MSFLSGLFPLDDIVSPLPPFPVSFVRFPVNHSTDSCYSVLNSHALFTRPRIGKDKFYANYCDDGNHYCPN